MDMKVREQDSFEYDPEEKKYWVVCLVELEKEKKGSLY